MTPAPVLPSLSLCWSPGWRAEFKGEEFPGTGASVSVRPRIHPNSGRSTPISNSRIQVNVWKALVN